jgi:hypothetical protein
MKLQCQIQRELEKKQPRSPFLKHPGSDLNLYQVILYWAVKKKQVTEVYIKVHKSNNYSKNPPGRPIAKTLHFCMEDSIHKF